MSTSQITWDAPSTQNQTPQVQWDDAPKEQPSIASRVWSAINTPIVKGKTLLDLASIGSRKPPDMKPGESTYDYLKRNEGYVNMDHPILAAIRSGLSGAVVDTADTLSSFTSPASLGMMAASALGKAVPAASKTATALKALQGTAAATFAGAGAKQVANAVSSDNNQPLPDRIQQGLQGAAMTTGGAAGAADAAKYLANPVISRTLLMGRTPQQAYESALKPSTTLSPDERAAIVNTGLQERIPVSKEGVNKIGDLLDALQQKVTDAIASNPNKTIDPNAVAARTSGVVNNFTEQVNRNADLKAIADSKQEFLDNNPSPIPADKAQAMKIGTYRVLNGKFGEQGSASIEAQKALARGLKEEIANQFPELRELNAAESKLYDLQPTLERAVGRISNHQLLGIGTPITAAATQAITGSGKLGMVAGALKAVLDDPGVKSRLAIALNKSGVPYARAVSRVAAYQASLASAAAARQSSSTDDTRSP